MERLEWEALAAVAPVLDVRPATGRAWFPVTRREGEALGFLAEATAGPLAPARPLEAADSARVRAWVAALAGKEHHPLLDAAQLGWNRVPVGLEVGGRSWELAAAAALVSHVLGRPPESSILVTGALATDGGTEPYPPGWVELVDDVSIKWQVCAVEAPGTALVAVEAASPAGAWFARWFGEGWRRDLLAAFDLSPETLGRESWGRLRGDDRAGAGRFATAALDSGASGAGGLLARWTRGALHLHEGRPAEAKDALAAVRAEFSCLPAGTLQRWTGEELDAWWATALIDHGRPEEAVQVGEAALARLRSAADPADPRYHFVLPRVAGSLAKALAFADRGDEAILMYQQVSLAGTVGDEERARTLGDLAEVLRRIGRLQQARDMLQEAARHLASATVGEAPRTRRFHRLYCVRAGLERPTYPVRLPDFSSWPAPAETLETLLQGPTDQFDAWIVAEAIPVAVGPVELLVLLGAAARSWGARRGEAVPPWIGETVHKLLALGTVEDGVASALHGLAQGRPAEWARRAPY